MENFKQDLEIPNSESNTETEFSRQVEECQSNLHRIEKLFYNLQKDSQRLLRKSQDSLAKSFNSNKKKLSNSCLTEQVPLQEVYARDNLCSNNNITFKNDTSITSEENLIKNKNSPPLTFVVQVPNSIVDGFKKNLANSDIINFLSQCSSKQSVPKKKGISSLFYNLFKRKKNNVSNLNDLILKNIKFVKFVAEPNQIETEVYESPNESKIIGQISATENNFQIKTDNNEGLSNANINQQDGHTLVFPINFNSNTNISEFVKANLVIQHEITPQKHSSLYTHTIKITNEPVSNSSQSSPKIIAEQVESEKKELEKSSLEKLQSENSLMKNFIENLLRSTKNLNDLEILKIFVEILHEEKLKKKPPCCMDCSNSKVSHNKESNFLHNFLQQLLMDLQNKTKPTEKKNIQQSPKRQSSKISICSSTAGVSSEEEYFDNPIISKSKRVHKTIRRCQSPSMMRYRFCQSEKDIDTTENKNK